MTPPHKSVLIVDDDEGFQFYMKSLFRKHPHIEVLEAYHGQDAIDVLSDMIKPPDIIFLDINMPVMNGHQFLETWTQKHDTSQTRVVIVSSSDAEQDKEKTQNYECVKDYVVKPEIAEKINNHLQNSTAP